MIICVYFPSLVAINVDKMHAHHLSQLTKKSFNSKTKKHKNETKQSKDVAFIIHLLDFVDLMYLHLQKILPNQIEQ